VEQRFRVPTGGQHFLTGFDAWLACQRGAQSAETLRLDPQPRYIANYRALAEFVHRDFSFQGSPLRRKHNRKRRSRHHAGCSEVAAVIGLRSVS
jgi:hypothetical protein